jgi:hypothetical protein
VLKFFLLPLLLIAQAAAAQVIFPPLLDVDKLKPVRLTLKNKKPVSATVFTSFAIKDLRLDTLTAGYIRFTSDYKSYRRLEFENGVMSATAFLNSHFQTTPNADTARLFVLLKNFYLTQEYKAVGLMSLANVAYISKAFVSARLLLQKGSNYFHMGDVDTTIAVQKWIGKYYNDLAQSALLEVVEAGEKMLKDSSWRAVRYNEFLASSQPGNIAKAKWKDGFYQSYTAFLNSENKTIPFQFEQRKKFRLLKPLSEADSNIVSTSWGFVENGKLYVRFESFYLPMQSSFGSYSGLGISFTQGDRIPLTGVLLQNPFMAAADMADLAINGPVVKMEHYRLFKLNVETGALE